jgi:hypothetical protein
MVPLNLLPSEAAKAETEYARRIGTSFGSIPPCSKTPYLPSTFLHIRFTLIEELMWRITIKPSQTFFVSMHHKRQSCNRTLARYPWQKVSGSRLVKTPIFSIFYQKEYHQASFGDQPSCETSQLFHINVGIFCDADDFIPWFFLISSSAFVNYFWAA